MAWSDSDKEKFFYQVKYAVMSGATPRDLVYELREGYFVALDDMKKQAKYEFEQILKNV